MPIDPSVQNAIKAPDVFGLMAQAQTDAMQADARKLQQQAVRSKLEADQRAAAEQQAVQRVLAETGGDWEVALPKIRQVAPGLSLDIEKQLGAARKSAAEALKADLDNEKAVTDRGLSLLRAIPPGDDALYQQIKPLLSQMVPDMAPMLPERYDPQALEVLQNAGLTAKEYADKQAKGLDRILEGKWREGAGTVLSTATDQADWDEMIAGFKELGMPAREIAQFGTTYSPAAAQRAGLLTMSPDARADNARAEQTARDTAARAATDDARQAATAAETARHNRVMEARPAASDNALVSIVGPDGKPVLVPRSQAVGKQPAGSRAGGGTRGVTSGDAGRLAELATSLDDVKVLSEQIGTTGAVSKLGAMTPKWAADLTGIGVDAQKRQAVIDRVKQVIGKALEGGVLRKEDEAKYEKILPTIGDPPAVAASKLKGLDAALKQRYERTLESLEDAGYDTSSYRTRGGSGGEAPPAAPASGGGGSRYQQYLQRKKGGG